jgi:hypothetical protein
MSVEDEFMSGGAKSASFKQIGDTVEGTICGEMERKHQTKPGGTELRYFPSGDPMYVYLIPVATEHRVDEDDDGKRTLWASYEMKKAIQQAVAAAGAKTPEKGAHLKVTLTGLEPTKFSTQKKLYSAVYTPAANNTFMVEEKAPEPETPVATVSVPFPPAPKPAAPAPVADNAKLAAAMASLTDEQKKALGLT